TERTGAALPGDHRPRRAWPPHGARWLVSAAQVRRPAPRPLRMFRLGDDARTVSRMSAATATVAPSASAESRMPAWLPLAALVLLAAGLRLPTLRPPRVWEHEARP